MALSGFGYSALLCIFLWIHLPPAEPTLEEPETIKYNVNSLKCHPVMTVNTTGRMVGNTVEALGYKFSEGYYRRLNKTHFSVCICKVKKCIRKCCGKDQSLLKRRCTGGFNNQIHPKVYDEDLNLLHNYDYSRFVPVYGDTCEERLFYALNPAVETDEYYFLEDGTLFLPNETPEMKFGPEEFCFEHLLQSVNQTVDSSRLAVLICFGDDAENENESPVVQIGLIISIPFLLATFLVYSIPELRNLHGKNLMSHVGSLFVAYVILVTVQRGSQILSPNICVTFGYIIQYSFLASFFWLNIMCFDIWWAFSGFSSVKGDKKSTEWKKYLIYCIYGWGCPAVITAVSLAMQFAPDIPKKILKPDLGVHRCFFTDRKAHLAYFYGPVAVIMICNLILFIMTSLKILLIKIETVAVFKGKESSRNRETSKQRYVLYFKLFLIMGVNWIMEVISWAVDGPRWVWYFTDLANALQGVLIFTLFVLRTEAKRMVSGRLSAQTMKSFVSRNSTKSIAKT